MHPCVCWFYLNMRAYTHYKYMHARAYVHLPLIALYSAARMRARAGILRYTYVRTRTCMYTARTHTHTL